MGYKSYFYLAILAIVVYILIIIIYPLIYSAQVYKTVPPKTDSLTSFEINSEQTKTLSVAVIGDSTAIGQGTNSVQDSFSYQYLIQNNNFQGFKIKYANYAISGAKISEVLDKQLIFEPVDIVFVSVGANDVTAFTSEQDFEDSASLLISKLQNLTKQIIWINIPDFITVPVFLPPLSYLASRQAKIFNTIIYNLVSKIKPAKLIDVYNLARQPFIDNPDKNLSKDKFHPSKAGYQIWVDLILQSN